MPCGGISRLVWGNDIATKLDKTDPDHSCFQCFKMIEAKDALFVEEWDCFIHYACLGTFLVSDEGMIVLTHEHRIEV